jgi:hypothetical protein
VFTCRGALRDSQGADATDIGVGEVLFGDRDLNTIGELGNSSVELAYLGGEVHCEAALDFAGGVARRRTVLIAAGADEWRARKAWRVGRRRDGARRGGRRHRRAEAAAYDLVHQLVTEAVRSAHTVWLELHEALIFTVDSPAMTKRSCSWAAGLATGVP